SSRPDRSSRSGGGRSPPLVSSTPTRCSSSAGSSLWSSAWGGVVSTPRREYTRARRFLMAREHLEMEQMVADPWGTLRRGRAAGWVAETMFGPAILAHEDMRELLGDPRLRADFAEFVENCGITSGPFYEWMAMSPLNRDGADHLRWRALMGRTFTPRRVEGLRPFLRTAAHGLIDAFAARGGCEFVAEFADVYP